MVAEFVNNETKWSKLKVDWEETIKPFAEEKGCTSFSAIGESGLTGFGGLFIKRVMT